MNPNIDLIYENRKELFPESFEKFPYLALRAELNRYRESGVPWHWHGAVEIFYMESGELEYTTPGGQMRFPAGSGGFVNSGVLHMTQPVAESQETVQLLHLFEPSLISGPQDGLIMQKFIQPITSRCDLQIIPITNISLLTMLRESFNLDEQT